MPKPEQQHPNSDIPPADPAKGVEPKPSMERALAGDEVRDDEVEHPTGEGQAEENRENEPPA